MKFSRRKRYFTLVCVLTAALIAIFACACKDEAKETPLVGTYRVKTLDYDAMHLELGDNIPFIGNITKDVAVVELHSDGTMSFVSKLIIVNFSLTGTWEKGEEAGTIRANIGSGETLATIPARCDGKTLVIEYEGITFTMEK